MSPRPLAEVLHDHTPSLMAIPGVVGTGEGARDGKPVILLLIARRTPQIEQRAPREIEGYPVVLQETGTVRALDKR